VLVLVLVLLLLPTVQKSTCWSYAFIE